MRDASHAMMAAQYFGRHEDAFENLLDNMHEVSQTSQVQITQKHNTATAAAFALGFAIGRLAGDAE